MKKFVLITVLLQLFLSVLEVNAGGGGAARPVAGASASQNQPQFGDLIEFPRAGLYSHYGIYVGGEDVKGKKPDENIFEMTSGGCRFIKKTGPFNVRNDYYTDPPQSKAGMKATIEALMDPNSDRCKEYSLTQENCEMVATLVRYGVAKCKQEGTIVAGEAKKLKPRKKRQECKKPNCHKAPAAA